MNKILCGKSVFLAGSGERVLEFKVLDLRNFLSFTAIIDSLIFTALDKKTQKGEIQNFSSWCESL